MGLIDVLASKAMGLDLDDLSARSGLSHPVLETVLVALGKAHTAPGDTVAEATAETGVERGKVQQVLDLLGGEDALAKVSGLISGGGLSDMLETK